MSPVPPTCQAWNWVLGMGRSGNAVPVLGDSGQVGKETRGVRWCKPKVLREHKGGASNPTRESLPWRR